MVRYGIAEFNVPLDTVQVISETTTLSSDVHLPFSNGQSWSQGTKFQGQGQGQGQRGQGQGQGQGLGSRGQGQGQGHATWPPGASRPRPWPRGLHLWYGPALTGSVCPMVGFHRRTKDR